MKQNSTLTNFLQLYAVPYASYKSLGFFIAILTLLSFSDAANLNAQNGQYTVSFGAPAINSSQSKAGITPFAKGRKDTRSQYLYLASELIGEGATAGSISAISYNITNLNGQTEALTDVNVRLIATTATELTDGINGMPPPNVSTPNTYLATLTITSTGWLTINLDNPFLWDGTSNILIEICKSNSTNVANNYSVQTSQGGGYVTRSRFTFSNALPYNVSGCAMKTYSNSGNNVGALTTAGDRKIRPDVRFTFACDGNPIAGSAVNKTPFTKCYGDLIKLIVEDGEVTTGLLYQWQVSTDQGITFSNIDGATGQSIEVSQDINKLYYRRQTICGGYSVNSSACMVAGLNRWNGVSWSRGIAPNSDESAVIDGDYSCQDTEYCSLFVVSGNMTVESGHTLTLGKQVAVIGGSLTFENNSNLIQESESTANVGNIIYKRNSQPVRKFDFTYWSSPVQNQQLLGFSPNTQSDKFYSWNVITNNWFAELNTNVMQAAKGYIIRAPNTFATTGAGQVFTGVFVGKPNNGHITTPLTAASQLNLIGNPYPSAVDAEKFLKNMSNADALDATLYFWTHNTTPNANITGSSAFNYTSDDYASWNFTGGIGMGNAAPSETGEILPDGFIAAGQSFMVKTRNGGVATFENNMRSTTNNATFFRNGAISNDKSRLWLQLANASGFKQTLVGYVDGATSDLDRGYDGDAMDGAVVSFYSLLGNTNTTLGIQGLPVPFDATSQVALGFKTTVAGEQQISLYKFDGIFTSQDVYLEDTFNGTIHNLKDSAYTFTSAAGTFNNRFILRYSNPTLRTETYSSTDAVIYSANDNIFINGGTNTIDSVVVYDLNGKILFSKSGYNSTELIVEGINWNSKVLIIQILTTDKSSITKKIIL